MTKRTQFLASLLLAATFTAAGALSASPRPAGDDGWGPPEATLRFWERQDRLFKANGWRLTYRDGREVVVGRDGLPVDPEQRLAALEAAGRIRPAQDPAEAARQHVRHRMPELEHHLDPATRARHEAASRRADGLDPIPAPAAAPAAALERRIEALERRLEALEARPR